jgi:hypothetical protein
MNASMPKSVPYNKNTLEFDMARAGNADRWVPASGGWETPFKSRSGRRLLYCYNPAQGKHAYLDVDNDVILTNEEASAYMQLT